MSGTAPPVARVSHARLLLAYWLPAITWMGVIFWFSAQSNLPRSPDPLLEVITKKSAHAAEYALLALLLLRAFRRTMPPSEPGAASAATPFWLAAVVCVLYAASDELHQSFTPNRTPNQVDVLIDSAGAILALLAARRYGPTLSRHWQALLRR